MQERRSKNVIKCNRGRPKKIKNMKKKKKIQIAKRCEIKIYLNLIATQTLTRNGVRNPEIIKKLN
jgi:hypothetical protein